MKFIEHYYEGSRKSREVHERARKVMPSGISRGVLYFKPYPTYAEKGLGSHIWDVDGNERIDYCLNYTVLLLGHSHPKVREAIKSQLDNGTALGAPTELEVSLAERISRRVSYAEKVVFAPSGTEAVMYAIRAARAFTGKSKIGVFEGAYHGTYDSVYSRSRGITPAASSDVIFLPFNDPDKVKQILQPHKQNLAAIIVEPVMGSNGPIVPQNGFLPRLREIADEMECLLISDEIITGFRLDYGGTGKVFGFEPDMVTFGKIVGGGLPASAVCGKTEVMSVFDFPNTSSLEPGEPAVPHAGTFVAHPLAMAAGIASLDELRPEAYDRLNTSGDEIMSGLRKLSAELGITYQVSGFGSLFHIFFTDKEITSFEDAKGADTNLIRHLDLGLLNRGVYFSPGHLCSLAAVTTKQDIDTTLDAVADTLLEMKPAIKELAPSLVPH